MSAAWVLRVVAAVCPLLARFEDSPEKALVVTLSGVVYAIVSVGATLAARR